MNTRILLSYFYLAKLAKTHIQIHGAITHTFLSYSHCPTWQDCLSLIYRYMVPLPTHPSLTPTILLVDRLSKSYIQIHGSFTHTSISDSNYYPTWPYFLSLIYRYMVPLPTHPSLSPTILLVDRLSKSHNQIHGSCTHKPLSYLTQTILHEHPSTTTTIQHGQIVSVSYSDT